MKKSPAGESLPERISAALDWCNTLILLWSANSAESYYVRQEWTSAFHLQKKIIACVLDGKKLPALLSGNLYLNFAPYESGYAQLCRSLGVEPKPRAEKTASPKSKLPPQHVEIPVPQPPDEKRESPPPKRKSIAEALRRKPKPPEIVDDTSIDTTNAIEIETPSRWPRRKIMTAMLALIIIAAVFLTPQLVCQDPTTLSVEEVKNMLKRNDFYFGEYSWNKEFSNSQGRDFANDFEKSPDGKVVYDHATGLTWLQSGSPNYMNYAGAEKYVRELNTKSFAGFNDWHLPTLEEAMSLMEPKKHGDLHIDPVFGRTQRHIWTADKADSGGGGRAWYVNFSLGYCHRLAIDYGNYVRAVRS